MAVPAARDSSGCALRSARRSPSARRGSLRAPPPARAALPPRSAFAGIAPRDAPAPLRLDLPAEDPAIAAVPPRPDGSPGRPWLPTVLSSFFHGSHHVTRDLESQRWISTAA